MSKQPVYLDVGLNHERRQAARERERDRIIGYLYLTALTVSILMNVYFLLK